MQQANPIEAVLKRDRVVVLAGGCGGRGTGLGLHGLPGPGQRQHGHDHGSTAVLVRREQEHPYVPTGVFLSGYLLVWSGFSAAATLANWGLHANSLLSSMMGTSTSSYLGGALLMTAGAFQWSPLKSACLTHCRSPLGFLMSDWREGTGGALRMGLRHGAYCVGCCWTLMGLLFVLGVMNLLWIAALAAFVLLEKVAPGGRRFSRGTGLLLFGWGALMAAGVLR